ncbi:class I SAM-dependent methyltransferase [Streptomyces sp. NPDC058295]|uniref:class I SAM-dependent methyltransferase n=1 Tax=Streptomyces sp. NPDC058295 TaxID=3346431 RepID=UPI0036E2B8C1
MTGRPGREALWRQVYDHTYRIDEEPVGAAFDTTGWTNTYTAEPYTRAEMEEWVDDTVRGITEHGPHTVLDIGCGTGLLGHRLMPSLDAYCGLDFSVGALRRFTLGMDPRAGTAVCLVLGSATHLDRVPQWEYDCVVLNSVLQYFPDSAYVHDVLRRAHGLVRGSGVLFLGDVRHRGLQDVHHAWAEWRSGHDEMTAGEARHNVFRRLRTDREWSAAPADLVDLVRAATGAEHIEIRLKSGTHATEMNLFRYDAVCHVGPGRPSIRITDWHPWETGAERRIDWRSRRPVGFLDAPVPRLALPLAAARRLRDAPDDMPLGELRAVNDRPTLPDPLGALCAAAREHGAEVRTSWMRDGSGQTCDLAIVFDDSGDGPAPVEWAR